MSDDARVIGARRVLVVAIAVAVIESMFFGAVSTWEVREAPFPSTCEEGGRLIRFRARAELDRGVHPAPRKAFALGEPRSFVELSSPGARTSSPAAARPGQAEPAPSEANAEALKPTHSADNRSVQAQPAPSEANAEAGKPTHSADKPLARAERAASEDADKPTHSADKPLARVDRAASGAPATPRWVASFIPTASRWSTLVAGRSPHELELIGVVSPASIAAAREAGIEASCVVWLEDFPPAGATVLALLIGIAAGILVWKGWPASEELSGRRVVLLSKSELHHVLQFAAITIAVGTAAAIDLLLRALGLRLVWAFPIGTIFYLAAPAAVLAAWFIAPMISRALGIGVPDR